MTASTISVAVVADVDNPIAPNVFKGVVDGAQAGAKYVNANGGVAGRTLKVDFIDSHLNPNRPATRSSPRAVRTSRWSAPRPRCSAASTT